MTTRYIGATENSNWHRLAVIQYNENTEMKKAEYIADLLTDYGYDFSYSEQEEIAFRVDNKDEYEDFVRDFRRFKKECISNNWKGIK